MEVAAVVVATALEEAADDEVQALIGTRAFNSDDIERLFDDAQRVREALGISADVAEVILSDMEAARAAFQVMQGLEAFGEALELLLILLEKIEHDPLGHFRSDGGEGGKMRDEGLEDFRIMHI